MWASIAVLVKTGGTCLLVAVVSSNVNLITRANSLAIGINSNIEVCAPPATAYAFQLFKAVSGCPKCSRPLKRVPHVVGTQAIADNWNFMYGRNLVQLGDLAFVEEMRLVHQHAVNVSNKLRREDGVWRKDLSWNTNANARGDDALAKTIIQRSREDLGLLADPRIVVGHRNDCEALAGPHTAPTKKQLRHRFP
jgi:hypothetical protein